jgi:hypothetical protein
VVDDEDLGILSVSKLAPCFVQTNSKVGLTDADVDRLVSILNEEEVK